MKISQHLILSLVAAAALAACGGGGDSTPVAAVAAGGGNGVPGGLAPSPNATPSAEITNSQTTADALKTEALAGFTAGQTSANGAGLKGPFGVESGALPSAVTGSIACSTFGGTGSIDYDFPATAVASGTAITYNYNACAFSGYTYNGKFKLVYTRYTSATDFAYTANYDNFTISGNGLTNQTISGSQSYDYANGSFKTYYSDGTRGWSSDLTYTGGKLNGSYAVNYGSGTVKVKYTNFGATSGTCEITGSNGSKILLTRTSATGFTMVLTDKNGVATTYSYS